MSLTSISEATRDLFSAIKDYSTHPDYRNVERDALALQKMRAALAAGAEWQALLGPGQRDAAFSAAACADRAPLELLLAHGVPLTHSARYDGMLIHRAAEFGRKDVIAMLVEQGIAPDARDPLTQRTPLSCARSWKHGEPAIPFLIELMRQKGCEPLPARRGDDLLPGPVQEALSRLDPHLLPSRTREVLENVIAGFFTERRGGRAEDFLREIGEQSDVRLLGAGVTLVKQASTAKPRGKKIKAKSGELIYHGDIEIAGDYDARALLVTGNVIVHGKLTNYEGRVIAVGGHLKANAVWTEGPLWVGADLEAIEAIGCCDNDYGALVQGTLRSPAMLQLDRHVVHAAKFEVQHLVTDRQDMPVTLAHALKISVKA